MRLRGCSIARSITTESELIWDLIQKGCGYPNRNKAWKGVPVNVKEALVILKGQNSALGFQNLTV